MRLEFIRTRIPRIETILSLRKQALIIISVLVFIVALNQLVISQTFISLGIESSFYFKLLISISAATFGGLTILLFEKSILSRIFRFNRDIKYISKKRDFSARVNLSGKDEIGQLAGNVNNMLEELEQAHNELQRSNHILKYHRQRLEEKIQEQDNEIDRLFLGTIESLVFALEAKDKYTAGHSRRVADISVMIGKHFGLHGDELDDLRWGALLHDVGKVAVDPAIQNKPGELTKEEYEHIMIHAERGADIVKPFANERVVQIIIHHHDRYDGTGLGQTEVSSSVPLGARIVAVADTFDAMTSDRPYRPATSVGKAIEEIARCSGTQFDPDVVEALLSIYASISIPE